MTLKRKCRITASLTLLHVNFVKELGITSRNSLYIFSVGKNQMIRAHSHHEI